MNREVVFGCLGKCLSAVETANGRRRMNDMASSEIRMNEGPQTWNLEKQRGKWADLRVQESSK